MKKTLLSRLAMLFVSAMGGALLFNAPKAFAATATWDGGGSDNKMTTAENWTGDVAPSAGDDLVFPAKSGKLTIDNDYAADTSFNSIMFNGDTAAMSDSNYSITGNAITLVNGISNVIGGSYYAGITLGVNITFNGNQSITNTHTGANGGLTLSGALALGTSNLTLTATALDQAYTSLNGTITGSGSMTFVGPDGSFNIAGNNSAYSGAVTVTSGTLVVKHVNALGTAAGATTVQTAGRIAFASGANEDVTYIEPLNLSGNGTAYANFIVAFSYSMGMGAAMYPPYGSSIFSGAITLNTDVVFMGSQRNAKITGTLTKNGHNLTVEKGTEGTLTIGGTTTAPAVLETEYKENLPAQNIYTSTNNTAIVSGSYGNAYISGGTLKGKGTVKDVSMSSGIIAPGLSPGCLNTGNLDFSGGTYQAELGGTTECTEYDQLTVTGTVALGTNVTTLTTSLYNSYKPVKDTKYTIIKNDGTDQVTGTFKDLAEGATFKVDGYTFTITYKGGDGNDVVLTMTAVPEAAPAPATPAPAAPDTGFGMLRSNPAAVLAVGMATLAVLAMGYLRKRFARN